MNVNLISCNAARPDKRSIAKTITEVGHNVSLSLANEFTEIILEGDAVEIEIEDKNSASALRSLRKLDIDYEIIE